MLTRSFINFLLILGLVAGSPVVIGAWIGGFAYSAFWAAFFLTIGRGAIFQVFIEILSHLVATKKQALLTFRNVTGFLLGIEIMYLTSLLVTV